jgi:hypothetical protein
MQFRETFPSNEGDEIRARDSKVCSVQLGSHKGSRSEDTPNSAEPR